jgi:hypothetical protein
VNIEGQRARNGCGSLASDRPQRWGALVTGVWTQRFARMWYEVTGMVPARIEVRPSNGLGGYNPDLESLATWVNNKQAPCNRIMDNDVTSESRGDNPLNH